MRVYLDIETSFSNKLTVIGMYIADNGSLIQMVGDAITPDVLLEHLDGTKTVYTYNGNRFDLPVINQHLGVNLRRTHESRDLMYDCWKNNLKGGLKAVEKALGISRDIFGRDEDDPRILWRRYRKHRDETALERLLAYNKEDTVNLVLLEERLKNAGNSGQSHVEVQSYKRIM